MSFLRTVIHFVLMCKWAKRFVKYSPIPNVMLQADKSFGRADKSFDATHDCGQDGQKQDDSFSSIPIG